jgi:membrane-associated HD superfamily phosphohydrolase
MTLEGKALTIASLTVFMYGLTSFFQYNEVIFPFPLNEIIFLITSIYFTKLHYQYYPKMMILIISTSLINVLSCEFYWNIFLSPDKMLQFSKSSITDFLKIAYLIGLIAWIISTFIEFEIKLKKYLSLIPITFCLIGGIFDLPLITFASITFLFFFSLTKIKQHPLLYLWILLFILEGTKVWSLASLK